MIRLEGLTMWYDETRALDGVDLHVAEGECFGFIGPNGAGKTTTIRILATLQQASGGRAFVGGVDVSRHPEEVRRLIGYMPDFFGIYDDLKAWEYLDFYAAAHGIPYRRRRELVRDVLDLVDLSSKADAQVNGLSRGMQQRLCLAKTLVHEPRVLLLDEPASGLDPRARIEMRALLAELRAMGKTIFISSHILSELGELCTQVGILEKGILLADGRPDELARRLKPHFELHVQVAGDAEAARLILEGREKIVSAGLRDGAVRATFEGTRDEIPSVLKALVDGGCAVFEFRVEAMDLEEIFLQVTRGEVQ